MNLLTSSSTKRSDRRRTSLFEGGDFSRRELTWGTNQRRVAVLVVSEKTSANARFCFTCFKVRPRNTHSVSRLPNSLFNSSKYFNQPPDTGKLIEPHLTGRVTSQEGEDRGIRLMIESLVDHQGNPPSLPSRGCIPLFPL